MDEATRDAYDHARRLGMTRREYMHTSCAAATALLALNKLGCKGGKYEAPKEAPFEPAAAARAIDGDEFIFDVQTHFVSTDRDISNRDKPDIVEWLRRIPDDHCPSAKSVQACYSDDVFLREVFLDSDTDLAVLGALWGDPTPTSIEEAARTPQRLAAMEGKRRLRIHGVVQPNDGPWEQVRDRMHALASEWKIDAWKLYPVWGPDGVGWMLDDELGEKTLETGLAAGVKLFAVHKGLPLAGQDPKYTRPHDVGPAAKAHPDATFLIYHSGYEHDRREGPYDPEAERGVDALIRSVKKHGVNNVSAELGSLWREVMKHPDEAAHVLGKLMLHLGEDRILWGTDAIWYGSPQDQIQAFRAFEITPELQEKYGYPALTPERKRKIFGLNGAAVYGVDPAELRRAQRGDALSRAREEYQNHPSPSHRTYGPNTRREMLSLLSWTRGRPD